MQGIIFRRAIPLTPTERFTARAKIACSQVELHVAPSDGFYPFKRVVNLTGSRASEDPRWLDR